jgi:hypothetical protein
MEEVKPYGNIYRLSFPNGNYIGQTIQGINVRWKEHLRDTKSGSNLPVHNAIRKYYSKNPEENKVNLELIANAYSFEELNELEVKYILEFNSFKCNNPEGGYNLTFGGEGVKGHSWTEEQRENFKIVQQKRKEDRPDIAINHSKIMKQRFKDNPELKNEHSLKMKKIYDVSPEKKENMSKIKRQQNKDNPEMAKQQSELKLMRYEDKDASLYKENLSRKSSQQWSDPDYRNKQMEYYRYKYKKEFKVYKDSNLIGSFDYVPDCAEAIFGKKSDGGNINKVLRGERKNHKGYEFKYS